MFTGIVEAIAEVVEVKEWDGDLRLRFNTGGLDLTDIKRGDSIAVNGVCLTAVSLPGDGFVADVSQETIDHTTVGRWQVGTKVNLEKALTFNSRLGGHIVTGHVDGVGAVVERYADARSERIHVQAPEKLMKYIAAKGSIAVDGTSLTVNRIKGNEFELNIIPHTLEQTIIGDYQVGTRVNLEVDLVARYLEQMMSTTNSSLIDSSEKF